MMRPFFALAVALLTVAISQAESHDDNPVLTLVAGARLTVEQAGDCEADLTEHPDDLFARTSLLGYYGASRNWSQHAKEEFRRHSCWIIKNRPDAAIAGVPIATVTPMTDPDGYREAKQLWSEQTKAHPQDVAILANAAQFLTLHDRADAEQLLKQLKSLEPKNPKWPDQLAHLYAMQADYAMRGDKSAAKNALAEFERAQSIDDSDVSQFHRLEHLARAAYEAGNYDKAAHYADESLKAAALNKPGWQTGNTINHANITLGRIALKKGNKKKAEEYLLKAGDTPGSPQLNSFGPNMSLAQELLKAGNRKAVLQYFDLCRNFWKSGGSQLDEWTKQVKAGQKPEFGANLYY